MKRIAVIALLVFSWAESKEALFQDLEIRAESLDSNNQVGVRNLEKGSDVKRMKFVSVNPRALSGGEFEMSLFDESRAFRTSGIASLGTGMDSVWSGDAPPDAPLPKEVLTGKKRALLDTFSLTRIRGKYAGYVYSRGRYFQLHAISKDIGILVERNLAIEGKDVVVKPTAGHHEK